MGINAYLNQQFNEPVANIPKGSNYPDLAFPSGRFQSGLSQRWTAPATCVTRQLLALSRAANVFHKRVCRDRISCASEWLLRFTRLPLSPVVNPLDRPSWETMYLQALDRGAFGNYRTFLQEITLNPAMGEYLDMRLSTRTNPERELRARGPSAFLDRRERVESRRHA